MLDTMDIIMFLILGGFVTSLFAFVDQDLCVNPSLHKNGAMAMAICGLVMIVAGLTTGLITFGI
jgi:hypothetical protein